MFLKRICIPCSTKKKKTKRLFNKTALSLTDNLDVAKVAQLAEAVEYTNCTPAEGSDTPQQVSWYDTKQSDGEVPVMLELWGILHCHHSQVHSDQEW